MTDVAGGVRLILASIQRDTQMTRSLCVADTVSAEDGVVMLAKKACDSSELPTRPYNPRPVRGFETVPASRTRLTLVRPQLTLRGLAWAERGGAPAPTSEELESMLRCERLNCG